jgi:hypothetical protein
MKNNGCLLKAESTEQLIKPILSTSGLRNFGALRVRELVCAVSTSTV